MRLEAIRILENLVKVPSPSGNEGEIAGLIKDYLSSAGVDRAFIDSYGNVIASVKGGGLTSVMIEGHMDTVDPGDRSQWHVDPYSAKIIDNQLYGRGSADMKGGIAAQISSIPLIKELDIDVYFIYTVHEETAEGASISRALNDSLRNIGFSVAVTGEATSLNLGVGHRGRALIDVELIGESAHASMPDEGINALVASSKYVLLMEGLSDDLPKHAALGKETLTPTYVTCFPPDTPQIPDKCILTFDHRVIIGRNADDILKLHYDACKNLMGEGGVKDCRPSLRVEKLRTWKGVELDVTDFFPAWINNDLNLVKGVIEGLRKTHDRVVRYVWRFSTDLAYVSGVLGVAGLGLGPGDERLAHKPDEHVSIAEVRKAVKMYSALINSLNKVLSFRGR